MKNTNHESLAEKHRIKKYDELVGQEKAIEEIKNFLKEFPKKRALLLYGPAGTGKTSLAWAAAKENNLEVMELNASDLRNRKKLEETLKPATLQASLFKKGKLLLVDEVDGVTGSDIGGIAELIRLIEETKHPIVITGNDIWQTKIAPLRPKCKLVEMKALPLTTINSILKKVTQKENIKKDEITLQKIAIKSQGDMRAALNDLQSYSSTSENLSVDTSEKRDVEDSIFNILRRVLKERGDFLNIYDTTKMSLDEILLWLEENIPKEYKNEALAKAYYALGKADIFRGRIYKNQSWRFLIYQNAFQSAGVSYAKSKPLTGFTKYEPPKRILKIWLNNQKMEKKKTIAKKYARMVHCSTKRAMRDFDLLRPIIQRPAVQTQLKLSEEEIEYLSK